MCILCIDYDYLFKCIIGFVIGIFSFVPFFSLMGHVLWLLRLQL